MSVARLAYAARRRDKLIIAQVLKTLAGEGAFPDLVLSIGGDMFSLDYGFPHKSVADCRVFLAAGIPVVIWSASVGPFSAEPLFEREMAGLLRGVDHITARESVSSAYLESIGVSGNVTNVADVAFLLPAIPFESDVVSFLERRPVGLNVSGLLTRLYPYSDLNGLMADLAAFVAHLVRTGYDVLLVPHVVDSAGPLCMDDRRMLAMVLETADCSPDRVRLLDPELNASETKWAIAQCSYFVGARTHSTIAALSSGVPTLAIAYSIKAKGIWNDIFGEDEYLLAAQHLSGGRLVQEFDALVEGGPSIRSMLDEVSSTFVDRARAGAEPLKRLMRQ